LVKDVFVNTAILISFISLGSIIIRNFKYQGEYMTINKIIYGILAGILGCVLMLFCVQVGENTIIDLRCIAIVISLVFEGTIPIFLSGIIISIFRVTYFGLNISSVIGVVSTLVISIGCWLFGRNKIPLWKKWVFSTIYVMVVYSIVLSTALDIESINNNNNHNIQLVFFCLVTVSIISPITYWYVNYCSLNNRLFRKLKIESCKDFLTGLNNVRQFDSILNKAMKNAYEKKESLSLLMVDIDFFKRVNDTYGHIEGDLVLKQLGKILTENCRIFDEVSRNGGEEFSVLLINCPISQALHIAERIRKNVETHPFILSTGKRIFITVSIGVAAYPDMLKDIEKLMETADTALYAAKDKGRNKVCI